MTFAFVGGLSLSFFWRVHRQGLMNAIEIVILEEVFQNSTEMPFAQDDNLVRARAAIATVEPFRIWILPQAGNRDHIRPTF